MNYGKLLKEVMSGTCDHSIRFAELKALLLHYGFSLRRISGSHHIFSYGQIVELIDLQPDKNDHSKAKAYQVKQVRNFLKRYPEVMQ